MNQSTLGYYFVVRTVVFAQIHEKTTDLYSCGNEPLLIYPCFVA